VARRKKQSKTTKSEAVEKFAIALERGRFIDYIDQLQKTKTLLWKNFLIGLTRGFGAVIGATLVVALVVFLLGFLGDSLPGGIGDFFTDTSQQINPTE
jgi:hypothetical protein